MHQDFQTWWPCKLPRSLTVISSMSILRTALLTRMPAKLTAGGITAFVRIHRLVFFEPFLCAGRGGAQPGGREVTRDVIGRHRRRIRVRGRTAAAVTPGVRKDTGPAV